VAENYGSHPHRSQYHSESGCLRNQKQNRYHRLPIVTMPLVRHSSTMSLGGLAMKEAGAGLLARMGQGSY
jgi:hypothetical protein